VAQVNIYCNGRIAPRIGYMKLHRKYFIRGFVNVHGISRMHRSRCRIIKIPVISIRIISGIEEIHRVIVAPVMDPVLEARSYAGENVGGIGSAATPHRSAGHRIDTCPARIETWYVRVLHVRGKAPRPRPAKGFAYRIKIYEKRERVNERIARVRYIARRIYNRQRMKYHVYLVSIERAACVFINDIGTRIGPHRGENERILHSAGKAAGARPQVHSPGRITHTAQLQRIADAGIVGNCRKACRW
jgi:hypothetical protein